MAATVSAWSKPGAWALDAEENETELLQQRKEDDLSQGGETADFPSLAAASTTKPKKKKSQTLSLHGVAAQHPGLTADEVFALPTGPRQRTAEELDRNKLGGGFRSYGGGGRDEQPRSFNRDSNREPSRADETDDWGAGKKLSANSGFDRRDRGGDSQCRADEVDNWASNKSFETRKYEKRGSSAMESNWGKKTSDSIREREEVSGGCRPRLNLQPRTLPVNDNVVKAKGSDPFGDARPREEVLKEKGQEWKEKLDSVKIKEKVAKGSSSFWGSSGRDRSWKQSTGETEKGDADSCEGGEGRDS